jgi:hypothetical protein
MAAEMHDLQRQVSIELLKSSRAFAVMTPRGQKDPGHFRWDPKSNSKERSDATIHSLERNQENLGVHLFGATVDVDVDTDNPFMMAALDYFLPPTSHIWGRPSRLRTHRLYELAGAKAAFDPAMFPFLEKIKNNPKIAVEVRGGELRNAQYSLLPGSVHPSGEMYEWDDLRAARSTPTAADMDRIVNGVRFACVAALIAPYWTEGVRNTLCMALSGFLHRAAQHVEEMGSASYLIFDKQRAKDLLLGVLEIADDDPADLQMRLRTFETTWDKAEAGEAVSGATSISKLTGDEEIVPLLYILLADSPDMVELDEFMERYAVRNGSSTIIDIERAGSKRSKYVMTVADLINSTMHKAITSAKGGKTPMSAILLRSTRAIRVDGLIFKPDGDKLVHNKHGHFVNQWQGWDIAPHPDPVSDTEVAPFLEYMKHVVANDNEQLAAWVLAWVADVFQNPGSKAGTALVLVGLPGAGKTMLGEKVIRPIIGTTHSAQTNSIDSITGNFNSDSANLLFMQCDEALNSRRRQDANKMKSMITDGTRRVEFKNVDAFEIEDFARYLMTSNDVEDAVAILDGENDRRYTVAHVNETYATGNKATPVRVRQAFWKRIYEFLEYAPKEPHVENLAKIHRWLKDYQYDRTLIRAPFVTQARRTMQQHSQRGFDDWLMEIVSMPHPFLNLREDSQRIDESYVLDVSTGRYVRDFEKWPDMINYQRLQESYDNYRKRKGMAATTQTYNTTQMKSAFISRKILDAEPPMARVRIDKERWQGGVTVVDKVQCYIYGFPTREKIAGYLWETYGFRVTEGEDVTSRIDTEPAKTDGGPGY